MLRHLKMNSYASRIEDAVFSTIQEKTYRTRDIGGSNSTREVTKAVIDKLA
jgi:isocitrate dehydrogenase (NAD+)